MTFRRALPVAVALLAASVSAQTSFVYAFSREGFVSANTYPLDALPNGVTVAGATEWSDLFVHGADRWLIRSDGKVALNGVVITSLSADKFWRGLVVDDAGTFFALSKGGRVAGPAGLVVDYPSGGLGYTDIVTDGTSVYVLRATGAVFRVPETDPIILFDGPPGEVAGATADGAASDTSWVRLVIDPLDGRLFALRHDGQLQSAVVPGSPPVTPVAGTPEAALPYNANDGVVSANELYADLAFDTDGTWFALRQDGRLFSTAAQDPPLVDLPGGPGNGAGQTYVSVVATGGHTLALRADGKLYRDVDTKEVVDLKSSLYVGLAVGAQTPDLSKVKNQKPVGSRLTVVAPEGADVELPVIATDRDKPTDELVVDVVADTLPAGATWDGGSRTISWPAAGPAGTYKIKVTIDDGVAKPVTATQTIVVKPPDVSASTNVKPSLMKAKGVVALAGLPFTLPVLAFDLDGDPLTLSFTNKKPPDGTSFDAVAGVLSWNTPAVKDAGSVGFKFVADDGTLKAKRTIDVKVETNLLGF